MMNQRQRVINVVDTTGFILKTRYYSDKLDIEKKTDDGDKKILDTSEFLHKTD